MKRHTKNATRVLQFIMVKIFLIADFYNQVQMEKDQQ